MTPEEEKRINDRFERIEANLERVAAGQVNHDATFARIDRVIEFLADNQAKLTNDIVALARIVRNHLRDDHGGEKV
jgi:hypothetical protein